MADKLCLTLIEATPQDADVFFPEIDPDEWEEQFRECHPVDDRHAVAYTFVDYIRKEKRERAE
jgi:dihydrofolate reductase